MSKKSVRHLPTTFEAYGIILLMILILGIGSAILGIEIKVLLMLCAAINLLLAKKCGNTWNDSIFLFSQKIADLSGTFIVMIGIGFVIGAWMISGTAPALVNWLSKLIAPKFILLLSFLLTGIMSSLIGSSFATMGTLGIVMFSTAIAQGIPAGMAAAAVICGSNVGQYISPLADCVSYISGINKIDIYEYIKNFALPVVISVIISAIFYFFYGIRFGAGRTNADSIITLQQNISENFNLNIVVVIPLVLALIMCFLKITPAIVLFCSGIVAIFIAIFVQNASLFDCTTAVWYGFDSASMLEGTEISQDFASFLDRGGVYSMSDGILFILIAMLTMSILEQSGVFTVIQNTLLKGATSINKLASITALFGSMFTVVTCDSYTTSAVMATSLRKMYVDAGYHPKKIASIGTAWCFMVEQILPWSFLAVYSASVYGVQVLDYVPGCIFYYSVALVTLLLTYMGVDNKKIDASFKMNEEK